MSSGLMIFSEVVNALTFIISVPKNFGAELFVD